jgi:hypothetical protein
MSLNEKSYCRQSRLQKHEFGGILPRTCRPVQLRWLGRNKGRRQPGPNLAKR